MKLFNNVLLIATLAVVPLTGIYAQPNDGMSVNGMSEEQTSKMREHMEEMDKSKRRKTQKNVTPCSTLM